LKKIATVHLKNKVTIKTPVTPAEVREMKAFRTLGGCRIGKFSIENNPEHQMKQIGIFLEPELAAAFAALQKFYAVSRGTKLMKRLILAEVVAVAEREVNGELSKLQKEAHMYCCKLAYELKKEIEKL